MPATGAFSGTPASSMDIVEPQIAAIDDEHAVPFEPLPPQFLGLANPHWIELAFDADAVRAVTVAEVNAAIQTLGKCTLVKVGTF